MVRIIFVLSLSLLFSIVNHIYGQKEYVILRNDTSKIIGEVSKSGQTIKIKIGEKKLKYQLSEVFEYLKSDQIYQVFSYDGYYKAYPLVVRGAVNLYVKTSGNTMNPTYFYYVKKRGQKYPQKVGAAQTTFHSKGFRDEYSRYFKDCDKVKNMIINKEVKPIGIQYIVETYNKCID